MNEVNEMNEVCENEDSEMTFRLGAKTEAQSSIGGSGSGTTIIQKQAVDRL